MLGGDVNKQEKMRMCPSCRTPISISAVKCRFCGEGVGRPKQETRELTIQDLGGESSTRHVSSANVMDAMEAFRAEELSQRESEKAKKKESTLFKRKPKGEEDAGSTSDLPELDQYHKDLAASVLSQSGGGKGAAAKQRGTGPVRVLAYVIGAAVLVVGAVQGFTIVQARLSGPEVDTGPKVVNRAPALIDQGAPLEDVLEAAVEAAEKDPSADNRRILDNARNLVVDDIRSLLNARPWQFERLDAAMALANAAYQVDASDPIEKIRAEARMDFDAYSMTLMGIEKTDSGEVAVFNGVHTGSGDSRTVRVRKDERLGEGDRFIVDAIYSTYVAITDEKRQSRQLKFRLYGRPQPLA